MPRPRAHLSSARGASARQQVQAEVTGHEAEVTDLRLAASLKQVKSLRFTVLLAGGAHKLDPHRPPLCDEAIVGT